MRTAPQHRPQPGQQLADAERLFHIVVGAQVEGVDLLHLAMAGGQDQDRPLVEPPRPLQRLLAVHVRQAKIQHHGVRRAPGQLAQPGLAGVGADRLVAGGRQRRSQEAVDLRLVVDDQDARAMDGHSSPFGVRVDLGREIRNRVPRPSATGLVAAMRPPMASMKPLAIDSPSPRPSPRSVARSRRRNRSKMTFRASGAMPGPSSSMEITTQLLSSCAATSIPEPSSL